MFTLVSWRSLVLCPGSPDLGAEGAEIAAAVDVGHQLGDLVRADGIRREEIADGGFSGVVLGMAKAAEECHIGERHLAGPIGGERHAGVRADELEIRAADDRHLDLVIGADEELGERGTEGDFSPGGGARGGADHVLLCDSAFQKLHGKFFGEPIGVGGVFHVGVEADHALVGIAERDQRHAIGLARGVGFARVDVLELAHLFHLLVEAGDFDRLEVVGGAFAGDGGNLQFIGGGLGGDAEAFTGFVQFFFDGGELVLLDGGAVLAHSLLVGRAPAFDGAGDDRQRARAVLDDGELIERLADFAGAVAVDIGDEEAVGFELSLQAQLRLLRRNPIALGEFIGVEDGDDVGELMVDDEVAGFPDLPFTRFAVADDAVNISVERVHLGGRADARGDAEALAQRAGRGIEEMHAELRIRMAIDGGIDRTERHCHLAGHRLGLFLIGADKAAEVREGRIDDRHGMPFGEHQAIGGGVPWLFRIPAHLVVHEDRDQMGERKGRRGVAAAGEVVKAQGKIVLATVKGDVHDIGKNIVGVVLACNNYDVIDLGVMVNCEKILERAKAEKADMIGLSGLITPSLDEMVHVAKEMERQGFKLPLLIGGATTSRAHTAIKIAPHYSEPVVHILDASRAVPVTTSLLSDDGKAEFVETHRAEYEVIRKNHAAPKQTLVPIAEARIRRTPIVWREEDLAVPEFTGVRVLEDFPLATLREYIDWSPFFHTWGMKGIYPRILTEGEKGKEAQKIFDDAQVLLDKIIAEKLIRARGVYGLFPANAVGDDIDVYTDETRGELVERFHFLRQQANREGKEPCRSLADFVAPSEKGMRDYVGAFAVTAGLGVKEVCEKFRAEHDDYNAIMTEAIADRLAEAFAECLHKRARDEWGYGLDEGLSPAELIEEKYRGIRPAPGYPACPDHTEKGTIWKLLDVEANTGMKITESFAMWPGSSVSGIYFGHPQARYFSLGKIGRDQVEDYAQRKGWSLAETERWLGPNLNY